MHGTDFDDDAVVIFGIDGSRRLRGGTIAVRCGSAWTIAWVTPIDERTAKSATVIRTDTDNDFGDGGVIDRLRADLTFDIRAKGLGSDWVGYPLADDCGSVVKDER
jgi:hypothetical protein